MRPFGPPLRRADVLGIVFVAVLVVAVLLATVLFPGHPFLSTVNRGLGPEWDCTWPGHSEPVCVKRPGSGSN